MTEATAGTSAPAALVRVLRPHQWVKNLLVLVPILLDHRLTEADVVARGLTAFTAFCLAASGGYILNDLLDVHADRAHPTKRQRPFASGALAPASAGCWHRCSSPTHSCWVRCWGRPSASARGPTPWL